MAAILLARTTGREEGKASNMSSDAEIMRVTSMRMASAGTNNMGKPSFDKQKQNDQSNHGSFGEELKLAECGKQLRSG
eukprot:746160-Hanusia_phi.AAC.1